MKFNGIEHYDVFEGDEIIFWIMISNPPQEIQTIAQEIDGCDFDPNGFGLCVSYSLVEKGFYLVTDICRKGAPEDERGNVFYVDRDGKSQWLKTNISQELLNRVFEECGKVVADREKEQMVKENAMNAKYEITDIVHEKYPFLHRIRALRDIGSEVKAGDLGGFVESESNLSFEPGDDAWIFHDAIAAGEGYVDKGSTLRDRAIVCGHAYASHGTEMSDDARAEDDAYIRGATLSRCARVSGSSMVLQSPTTKVSPILTESCAVYGKVMGDVTLSGTVVVISDETISNDSLDTLLIDEQRRTVIRDPSRNELAPRTPQAGEKKKAKRRDAER